jgi:hypothetical protein
MVSPLPIYRNITINESKKISTAVLYVHEKLRQELFCFAPSLLVYAITDTRAFNIAFNKTDAFQLGKVLRDSRLGQWKLIDDVAADTSILLGEKFEDRDTGWMCQCFCQIGKAILIIAKRFFL